MSRFRNLLFAVLVWLACLFGWAAFTMVMGGELDSSVLVPAVVSGVLVAGTTSQAAARWNNPRSTLAGFGIGVLPSCVGLMIGALSPKGLDGPAMWVALSLWLAVPNGLGGALGGFLCARRATAIG